MSGTCFIGDAIDFHFLAIQTFWNFVFRHISAAFTQDHGYSQLLMVEETGVH